MTTVERVAVPAVRVTVVDQAVVVLRYDEITAGDVADFNAALARPAAFSAALREPSSHDLDIVAGLVWLGLRRGQPKLTFAQVADSLTYDSVCLVELIPDLGDDDG